MKSFNYFLIGISFLVFSRCQTSKIEDTTTSTYYNEPHRLQFHFSPEEKWMNDPNGMVFYEGEYHLFYQYYPDSTVWGPMHWGHAISTDLVHWEHMPIALYPDSLGYIFSGSAVVDLKNTSGFGSNNNPPLVAIYTYHDPVGADAGREDFQTQGIAFSIDKGRTWTKYGENPVLGNPGIKDFRDPKVFWHDESNKWMMILAVKDRVHLYSSQNLKEWTKESEFGENVGAHGGVWECPDLFPLEIGGETKWVMLVSINPGGPNGGSATQYFVGGFDGQNFNVDHDDIRWLDWGPDNYAGVTWSNVTDRRLFLGWMSNWAYANTVPTEVWRSAMTIPRELKLVIIDGKHYVTSEPVQELEKIVKNTTSRGNISVNGSYSLSEEFDFNSSTFGLEFELPTSDFSIVLSNELEENVSIGYDAQQKQFFIDRKNSGKIDFNKNFPQRSISDRISNNDTIKIKVLVDVGSIELFADDGKTVMTSLFFPNENFANIAIKASKPIEVNRLTFSEVENIWDKK